LCRLFGGCGSRRWGCCRGCGGGECAFGAAIACGALRNVFAAVVDGGEVCDGVDGLRRLRFGLWWCRAGGGSGGEKQGDGRNKTAWVGVQCRLRWCGPGRACKPWCRSVLRIDVVLRGETRRQARTSVDVWGVAAGCAPLDGR
jgi:hypothetical protein